jgi:hypothetical protein
MDLEKIAAAHKGLNTKKTFVKSCHDLAEAVEEMFAGASPEDGRQTAIIAAARRAFIVLQTRYTEQRFWEGGLHLFVSLEFHLDALSRGPTPSPTISEVGSSVAPLQTSNNLPTDLRSKFQSKNGIVISLL